jgi:hypothetical protein
MVIAVKKTPSSSAAISPIKGEIIGVASLAPVDMQGPAPSPASASAPTPVILGLDPRIYSFRWTAPHSALSRAEWFLGSSPRMTAEGLVGIGGMGGRIGGSSFKAGAL